MFAEKISGRLGILILWGVLSVIFISGCNRESEQKIIPEKVTVQKVQVKNVPFRKVIIGQTVAEAEVDIKARITGYLEKMNFKYGSIVNKGQVLYQIEKNIYQAELKKDNAKLQDKIITLQNAKIDYERQKELVKKSAVAVKDYDEARTAFLTAQANVLSAEADVKIAQTNLNYCTISSPVTGKIGISNFTVGNLISQDTGTLVNIVQLDPMMVEFNPDENLYLSNSPDDKDMKNIIVEVILSNNKTYKHKGRIDYVNNKVDPATGTIQFRAAFPNPDNFLLPGQYVKVILEKKDKIPSVIIPQASVLTGQIGEYVFVVDSRNTVSVRKIVTGISVGKDIAVTKGLKKGEIIVVEGVQKLNEGQVINPLYKKSTEKIKEKSKRNNKKEETKNSSKV